MLHAPNGGYAAGAGLPYSPGELFEWTADLLYRRYSEGGDGEIRVVVVLGAGSSVWSGLPTWDQAFKTRLIDEAGKVFKNPDDFVTECWRKLNHMVGIAPDDPAQRKRELIDRTSIEDISSVALESAIVSDVVYRLLSDTFTPVGSDPDREIQPPQLAYELIAHFLKHAFVDHLITFNFDELLDEAIRNELGRHDFKLIASDQDIASVPTSPLPHLIKLHGTLSRPGTLRFTRAATSSLPAATLGLLDAVVFGRGRRERRRTFVVSLGYGWGDADVMHWMQARKEELAGLVVLSKSWDCERLGRRFPAAEWPQVRVLDVDALCSGCDEPVTVDLFLWALCRHLEEKLATSQPEIPFMPAARHLLLSYLFSPVHDGAPGQRLNNPDPLRRFVVEFVLHVAKCKGMVNLSTLSSNERIGRYYALIRQQYAEAAKMADTDLLELVTSIGFVRSPRSFAPPRDRLTVQLSHYPDVKETYFAVAATPEELGEPLLNRNGFRVAGAAPPVYSSDKRRIVAEDAIVGTKFVESQIRTIFDGPEIEVARRESERESWTLRSAMPLATYIDLQQTTQSILEGDWSDLLVVAESGAWLASESNRQRICTGAHRRIFLLTAATVAPAPPFPGAHTPPDWPLLSYIERDLSKVWDEYREAGIEVLVVSLPWWQHNRHMTLAFRRQSHEAMCIGGVYFRRRHKKSRIQPLALSPVDSEDVGEIMLTFMAYLRRAFEERRRRGLPIGRDEVAMLTGCRDLALRVKVPRSVEQRLDKVRAEFDAIS